MNIRLGLLIILFGFLCTENYANPNDSITRLIFYHIYNQEFSKAESELASGKNLLKKFQYEILSIDLCWWKYKSSKSNQDLKFLKKAFDDFSNNNLELSEGKIVQLVVLSYRMRFDLKRFNFIDIPITRGKIREILQEINRDDLLYSEDKLKLFDLYKDLFFYFDNFFTVKVFVNKSERLITLKKIENYTHLNDSIIQTYAHYFLGKIWLDIERNPDKALIHFKKLTEDYPQNKLFEEYYGECLTSH